MRAVLFSFLLLIAMPVFAQENPFHVTPYALPRFVTLGSDEVNVRTGPGPKYPITWVYNKKGLPVEVVLEYEVWRKIRDKDGEGGWVHSSLLSGNRAGIIQAEDYAPMRNKPEEDSKLRVKLERGAVVSLDECEKDWCEVDVAGYSGWVKREFIWGVYKGETFD